MSKCHEVNLGKKTASRAKRNDEKMKKNPTLQTFSNKGTTKSSVCNKAPMEEAKNKERERKENLGFFFEKKKSVKNRGRGGKKK